MMSAVDGDGQKPPFPRAGTLARIVELYYRAEPENTSVHVSSTKVVTRFIPSLKTNHRYQETRNNKKFFRCRDYAEH